MLLVTAVKYLWPQRDFLDHYFKKGKTHFDRWTGGTLSKSQILHITRPPKRGAHTYYYGNPDQNTILVESFQFYNAMMIVYSTIETRCSRALRNELTGGKSLQRSWGHLHGTAWHLSLFDQTLEFIAQDNRNNSRGNDGITQSFSSYHQSQLEVRLWKQRIVYLFLFFFKATYLWNL